MPDSEFRELKEVRYLAERYVWGVLLDPFVHELYLLAFGGCGNEVCRRDAGLKESAEGRFCRDGELRHVMGRSQ